MKQQLQLFFLFLILNFTALGLGVYLMNGGPLSEWYTGLNQAPWTPPNPVFGIAWTTIMICFAFYITSLVKHAKHHSFIWVLFGIQWILNSGWNYIFFNQQMPILGLIDILLLFLTILYFFFRFRTLIRWKTLWITPYVLWLIVAISLNGYIVAYNP